MTTASKQASKQNDGAGKLNLSSVEVLLCDWQDKMLALDKQTNRLAEKWMDGNFHEHPIVYASDKLGESYTLALSVATGIPHGLLIWYAYDNYFGSEKLVYNYGIMVGKTPYTKPVVSVGGLLKVWEAMRG